jgi:hypothetical protein
LLNLKGILDIVAGFLAFTLLYRLREAQPEDLPAKIPIR